jgi:ornithine carbamoyltransferase
MNTAVPTTPKPSDLLRISDFTGGQLNELLDLAGQMRDGPTWWAAPRSHAAVACAFDRPSTRTRVAFEVAAHRLGMLPILLRPEELRLGRGERLADTARVLSSYASAIVVRTFAHATVEEVAAAANVPVINAVTDQHHPCQVLGDMLTLRGHYGYLKGIRLAYVGEGNNVAHSLMEAGALSGMHVAIATPPGFAPDHDVTMRALALAGEHGGSIQIGHDPRSAVAGADAVYTDVWASMGEDAEHHRLTDFQAYQVNDELMRAAAPGAVFMHCLPAHRGLEVTDEVMDGPASIVWAQAANRLPVEQAVLHTLVGTADRSGG